MSDFNKQAGSLSEKAGISSPEITNVSAINQIKNKRRQQPSAAELISGILCVVGGIQLFTNNGRLFSIRIALAKAMATVLV